MSKVKYMVGNQEYYFETNLQIISKEQLFQVEEHLMEEAKEHKIHLNPQPKFGYIHNLIFEDDNGFVAKVADFKKPGNMSVYKKSDNNG